MTDEKDRTLEHIAVLGDLPEHVRRALEKQCRWREFPAQEQIVDRLSDSRDVYFVARGKVRVVNYSYSGREISYADLPAGGFFGEIAAIDGAPRSANVVALTDTLVAILAPELFIRLLADDPKFALTIMKGLTRIIRSSTDRIVELSTLGAANRIHVELLRLGRPHVRADNTAVIRPAPLHVDIASRAGTTRESVTRALSELARQGIIRRQSDALVVLDVERLEELVEIV